MTVIVEESTVVVVPVTCKLPATIIFLDGVIVKSPSAATAKVVFAAKL